MRANRLARSLSVPGHARRSAIRFAVEPLESRRLLSVNVLNYHGDTGSTGLNSAEVNLTPANVKVGSFGKIFTTMVDGQIYAEPLIDTGVTIAAGVNTTAGAGGVHDVVFVSTQNDTIYAIDSSAAGGAVLWKRSFLSTSNSGGDQNNTLGASAIAVVTSGDVNSSDISPSIGITGTPVIDAARNVLYVVAKTKETIGGVTHFVQRIHAISLSDGTDAATPFLIGDTVRDNSNNTPIYVYGTGDGNITDPYNNTGKPVVQFNALHEAQRPRSALLTIRFISPGLRTGTTAPITAGWRLGTYPTSPAAASNSPACLIPRPMTAWQESGKGAEAWSLSQLAARSTSSPATATAAPPRLCANGLPTNANYNEALVKAVADPASSPTHQNPNGWGLKIVDFFTPHDVVALDNADSDFGSGAPILLPDSAGIPGHPHLIVVGGKDGRLFVVDRDNLGHYSATDDHVLNSVPDGSGNLTPPNLVSGLLSTPAWYNGSLYVISGYSGPAYAFGLSSTGILNSTSQSSEGSFGYLPGAPIVSSNGTTNGIVWAMDRNLNEIHAYDANSLSTELWNSSQAAGNSDSLGAAVKFAVPTVANGEVYVGTSNSLVVYGLAQPANAVPQPPVLAATALSGSSINLTWTDSSVAPNKANVYLIEESTDGVNFTQAATAPAGATSIAIGGLSKLTKYYFRVRGSNGVGKSGYSNIANATTTSQTALIDFTGGFAAGAGQLALNGSAVVNGASLQLTDGGGSEAASAYYVSPVDVTGFSSQFTFQISAGDGTADGFTFVLQNAGLTAIGAGGGGLGYGDGTGPINHSIAIKFDLYDNSGEGPDSTGLYTNGAAPYNVGAIDLTPTGINLHSGDIFQANLTYDGKTLTEVIKDTQTNATATESYTVNIPSVIGSGTAYAGFTGGTGGLTATQDVLTWTYSPTAAVSPNAPSGLGATAASATSVNLNWTNNATNQTGYHLDRATDAAFTQNLITQTLAASPASFTDITAGLAPGGTFYYRLRAFNSAGDSGNSNTASVTIPFAPPKPTNQQILGVTTTEIDLSWQDNAGHAASGYNILRAINHGTFSIVATLPPTSRPAPSTYTWSDTKLTPGAYYEYHIEAYNVSGNNDFAGLNATTLTLAPQTPLAKPGTSFIDLSWAAVVGAVSYNVYRGTTPGSEGATPIVTGLAASSYHDTAVTNGVTYYYKITAVNANATYTPPLPSESARSGEASAAIGSSGSLFTSNIDIGSPKLKGSATFANGAYTVASGGLDVWAHRTNSISRPAPPLGTRRWSPRSPAWPTPIPRPRPA